MGMPRLSNTYPGGVRKEVVGGLAGVRKMPKT